jgi:hypothetical protein
MAVKYVKDFDFGKDRGFTGSVSHKKPPGMKKDLAPAKPFKGEYQGYAKGGMVKTLDKLMRERRAEMPAKAAVSERGMPMAARPTAAARPMMDREMPDRMASRVMPDRSEGLGMSQRMFKKGGKVKGDKIAKVMREYKKGELHSGKKGPVVKNPKQAMAIALSEAGRMKKADGGAVEKYSGIAGKKEPYRGSTKKIGKELGRQDRMNRLAEKRMKHAEKYAPGLSLDMEDKPAQAPMSKYAKGGAAVKKAVHKHEKAMHPGKPLTKLKKGGVPAYGRKAMYGGGKC